MGCRVITSSDRPGSPGGVKDAAFERPSRNVMITIATNRKSARYFSVNQ
jgi:hypothetical protein